AHAPYPPDALLTGGVVVADGLPGRGLEVAVREHEERAFASELTGERDDVPGRRGADVHGGLGGAGERDPAHARMPRERGAALLADPLDDVEDARWEACLGDEVAEERAGERRPPGGL